MNELLCSYIIQKAALALFFFAAFYWQRDGVRARPMAATACAAIVLSLRLIAG